MIWVAASRNLDGPQPGNPHEAEGVLNPAAARGPDGELYLSPRLVAHGNYSRIGIARVRFNEAGDRAGVERLGIALEPETDYERGIDGRGGCEDPRVTFVEPLQRYLMTYTARSPRGPRIAAACSTDLFHWKRLGLVPFAPFEGLDLRNVDDKDACPFPAAIPNPFRQPELAMLHRPLFPGTAPEEKAHHAASEDFKIETRDGGQSGDTKAERAELLTEADDDAKSSLREPTPIRNEVAHTRYFNE